MPITPTYPGIYIEELPSSAHTITAAPTSYGTARVPFNRVPLVYPTAQFGANYCVGWTTCNAADYEPVFRQDSALDKVSIFNLLVLAGVADTGIWSEALAFCERKQAF